MNAHATTSRSAVWAAALAVLAALTLSACAVSPSGSATSSSGGVATTEPQVGAPSAGTGISSSKDGYGVAPDTSTGQSARTSGTESSVQKLIVINKTVRIETSSVDAAITRIRELVARDGGDIASMQVSTSTDEPVYPQPLAGQETAVDSSVPLKAYVTVRVPTAKFGAFVADVARIGRVLFQSQSAEDVTQQHVDMQARLQNMKAEETRLRQLFAKATKVSDMLAIEQELTRVQGDIESMQAQITYLENQAAMATVTIELKEPTPIVSPSGTDWGVGTAFTDSIRAFVNTMNGLIVLLGPAVALLVFVGIPVLVVILIVRAIVRRRRGARSPSPAPAKSANEDVVL